MNFEQARNCLLKGSKVRRHNWSVNEYIFLNQQLAICDETTSKAFDVFYDYDDNEWAIFDEHKKPFKVQTLEWFKSEDKIPEKNSFIYYCEKNPTEVCKKYNNNIQHGIFGLSDSNDDNIKFTNHVFCWAYSGEDK